MVAKHCKYWHWKPELTTRFTTHFARCFMRFYEDLDKTAKITAVKKASKYKDLKIYERIYKHDFDTFCVPRHHSG